MSNPIIRIHNIETNEVIDREMTDEEVKKLANATLSEKAEAEAKAQQRLALLERLGITEDEAKLLLG